MLLGPLPALDLSDCSLGSAVSYEREVVGTNRGFPVTHLGKHHIAVDEKHAGQLFPMRALPRRAAPEDGAQPASPDAWVSQLEDRPFVQLERAIDSVLRIAEPRHVRDAV